MYARIGQVGDAEAALADLRQALTQRSGPAVNAAFERYASAQVRAGQPMPSQYQFISQLDPSYYGAGGTTPGTAPGLPTRSMSDPLSPGPSNQDQAQKTFNELLMNRQRHRRQRRFAVGQAPDVYEEHTGYCFASGTREYCRVVDWQTGRPAALPQGTEVIWQLADPYGRVLPLDRNDPTKGNAYFAQVPAYRAFIWIAPDEVADP